MLAAFCFSAPTPKLLSKQNQSWLHSVGRQSPGLLPPARPLVGCRQPPDSPWALKSPIAVASCCLLAPRRRFLRLAMTEMKCLPLRTILKQISREELK